MPIDETRVAGTYLEAAAVCDALDRTFSRALVAEYGVADAGQRRYDEVSHDNPVLEQLKQDLIRWKKRRDELRPG